MTLRNITLAATTLTSIACGPALAQSFTTEELGQLALDLGAPGMTATFRNQVITVTGPYDRFSDPGFGDVWVNFKKPYGMYSVTCSFSKDDIAAYDRFALMAPGTVVTLTGKYSDTDDAFYMVNLVDCIE